MGKIKLLAVLGICGAVLAACGAESTKNQEESSETTSEVVSESEEQASVNIPEEETGTGYFNLVNASGSTEMGQPITVFYEPDTVGTEFDIETTEFDGSHLTYIYVDGVFVEKQQFSESQHQFDVPDNILEAEGTHIVSLVQYDNDQEDGNPITVKHQAFEVKH